jgi:hypothetical protein
MPDSAQQTAAALMTQKLCKTQRLMQRGIAVAGESAISLQRDLMRRTSRRTTNLPANFLLFGDPPAANLRLLSQ